MIVCNATPLIAFARIQQLDLLCEVAGKIVIPAEVADEIRRHRNPSCGAIHLEHEDWISIEAVQSSAQVQLLLPVLDRGEAEVIALALERQAKLVLMDELTGRKVAQSLDLPVTGTVGILIRAKQKGLIAEVGPLLEKMRQCGIRYSERFIRAVLHEIGGRIRRWSEEAGRSQSRVLTNFLLTADTSGVKPDDTEQAVIPHSRDAERKSA